MFDRSRDALDQAEGCKPLHKRTLRAVRPRLEDLEGRSLPATLMPIANVTVPQFLGYQVPLDGGSGNPQTYTVTSDNPNIVATVAQGKFLTIDVTHASSGANDPAFAGTLVFQLFDDLTPLTTSRIETLVNQGFYTGKNFHRIASGFPGPNDYIVQGGSVNGNGTGDVNQPGFPFADEFVQQLAFTGTGQLAMANAGDDTNSSQFFVTTGSPRFLDYQHTIFGQLVSGQQTLQLMTQVAKGSDGTTPVSPVLIAQATLSDTNPDGVIHVDATKAAAGQTANITVTATDPSDGSTVSRSFQVNTTANTQNERPFLQPVSNQVVGTVSGSGSTVQGQTAVFQLQAVDPNGPGDQLTFRVAGGKTTGANPTFTPVANATATVDANGVVRVVPNPGFTGVINLLVGVRNQVAHPPNTSVDAVDNYDTQMITLTVNPGPEVNLAPIALPGTSNVLINTPSTIQLEGDTANPASSQTLTFTLLTGPTNGTFSQFDPQTGTFLYTPNPGFTGTDTVTFRVRDAGNPTPNLDSLAAVQTIVVGGGTTGSVRLIGRFLVVTPPPRTDSVPNTVAVTRSGDNVLVTVNGVLDSTQPSQADLDKIVVFGSKASDVITVDTAVTVPTTLDGGHGGDNIIRAGGASTRAHGWFGRNRIQGSTQNDAIIGRAGRFRVRPSPGTDRIAAVKVRQHSTLHKEGAAPVVQAFIKHNGRTFPNPQMSRVRYFRAR
jgi:cyclophilin family peptidyl-prolyl cis-trans isomerase